MIKEGEARLGFWSIVLLGINAIIGSGIFLLPGKVMNLVGHWSIAVYFLVSVIVMAIAWCFAQCATLFSRNGGAYVYAKEAFGEFIGFEIGVMRWVVGILAWAAMAVGFVTALSVIWPTALEEPTRTILVLAIVGGLSYLNILGINIFKQVNNIVTVTKILLLFIFVGIGLFFIQGSNFAPLNWETFETGSFGSAALIIFYAFSGFECLVVAAGDMENPRKNLPLAVITIISFCSLLYFSIQLTAIGLLGEALSQSAAPLADAAQFWVGDAGKWFIILAMLISIGGINLSASFLTPRSGVALAEDGLIPKFIASSGRYGTPVWAILISSLLTCILALSGSFAELAVISVVSRFAQYISTCLAVYVFHRRKKENSSRLLNTAVMIIPAFALLGISWLMMQATLVQLIWGLGALLAAVPLYAVYYLEKRIAPVASTTLGD